MRKLYLILSCLVFLRVAFPAQAIDFPREIFDEIDFRQEEIVKEKDDIIFSDPAYSQPTHNFSPGQRVYIKVEAFGGEKGKTLRLLDSSKNEIQRLTLNQSGNVFTTSFTAPETSGIYYIDIKIEGEGSSFASQENINVGKGCTSCSVSSEAESVAPSPTSSPTLTQTPTLPPERPPASGFISKIISFVRTMLSNLTRYFK